MYSFKIDVGSISNPVIGSGYVTITPFKNGVKISKKPDTTYKKIIRKKLDGELVFKDADYTCLKSLYDSGIKYVDMKVYYNGSERLNCLLMILGNYDLDKHTCSLVTQTKDQYSEFLKNIDTEVNIKNIPPKTIKTNIDPIYYTVSLPCTGMEMDAAMDFYNPNNTINQEITRNPEWAYFQHLSTTSCGTNQYIYTFYTHYFWFYIAGLYPSELWIDRWLTTSSNPYVRNYDSYILLFDLLKKLLEEIDPFITIDEETYCDYYNAVNTNYKYIFIADKSDAKRPDATEPSSYENISMKTLLDLLYKMTNVTPQIDEDLNFKLIHDTTLSLPSFATYPKHDLTSLMLSVANSCTLNQTRFVTKLDNKVSKESWEFEQSNIDFQKITVDYETYDENKGENSMLNVNNNIIYLKNDPEDAADTGFVFAACSKQGLVYTIKNTPSSPYDIVNGYFNPENLFRQNFQNYNRPYRSAIIKELLDEEIVTVKEKDNIYSYIAIPIYDIDQISFDYLVKSEAGNLEPTLFEVNIDKSFSIFEGVA